MRWQNRQFFATPKYGGRHANSQTTLNDTQWALIAPLLPQNKAHVDGLGHGHIAIYRRF